MCPGSARGLRGGQRRSGEGGIAGRHRGFVGKGGREPMQGLSEGGIWTNAHFNAHTDGWQSMVRELGSQR